VNNFEQVVAACGEDVGMCVHDDICVGEISFNIMLELAYFQLSPLVSGTRKIAVINVMAAAIVTQ